MINHNFFLNKCIELAKNGIGYVSPNPLVGCVIVYNDKIIGQGYHETYGGSHAEVNAINNVKEKKLLRNSTLYVNLEPCSHFGKTPPCCDLIIKYKIPKVVIGCKDTFSLVNGQGIERMKNAGIEVIEDVLLEESVYLNRRFFTFNDKKRPYIIIKYAKSIDGFIAPTNQKEPFWMTSEFSKKLVHKWRADEDSILVGRKTCHVDNPQLNVRFCKGENPKRIIIDPFLKLNKKLKIFNSNSHTFVFNFLSNKLLRGSTFVKLDKNNFLSQLLDYLYRIKIQSIIIEGGAYTINSFLEAGYWDEARIFTSPIKLKSGIYSPIVNGTTFSESNIGNDKLDIILNND